MLLCTYLQTDRVPGVLEREQFLFFWGWRKQALIFFTITKVSGWPLHNTIPPNLYGIQCPEYKYAVS